MALFSRKKDDKTADVSTKLAKSDSAIVKNIGRDLARVLRRPRITEKAVKAGEAGVYVFVVAPEATKRTVRDAVKAQYDVTVRKVNIVNRPARFARSHMTGRRSRQSGQKKAYVYLKKGDSISLV